MIKLKTQGVPDVRRALKGFEDQIPFTMAVALTRTAKAVEADLRDTMQRVFDNPTRFTMGSTFTRPATKGRPVAIMGLKDSASRGTPAAEYLRPQIKGGRRRRKRFERSSAFSGRLQPGQYLVPGRDARLNKFGNITRNVIQKVIDDLKLQDAAKAAKQRGSNQFFWLEGKGVFFRRGKKLRSLLVVADAANYRKRLDFIPVNQKSIEKHLPIEMRKAIDQALSTARPR